MGKKRVTIYETKRFAKNSKKLLGNKERVDLFEHLVGYPKSGDVIPGSGGIRKLRWKRPGMGKRGGVRVIYYFMDEYGLVSLLTVYAKSDKETLTKKEVKEFNDIIKAIKLEMEEG